LKEICGAKQNLGEHKNVEKALTPNATLGYGPAISGLS